MRFTEALKRDVVATSSASSIGRVTGFVVDPRRQQVVALRIGKADHDTLAWSDVTAFGVDAVTVDSTDRLRSAEAGPEADQTDLLGHRVLDDHGVEHGTVQDVEFDPDTGQLRYLLTSSEEVDGSRLHGVGSWAAVITAL